MVTETQDRRKSTGRFGEEVAAAFLIRAGMEIVARNWRCRDGEIDIVARDGSALVFVEVRTRSSRAFGRPEESIDLRKQRQVRKVAARYLNEATHHARSYRFDAVLVDLERADGPIRDVRHVRNAF
jgi:putative endonuclease